MSVLTTFAAGTCLDAYKAPGISKFFSLPHWYEYLDGEQVGDKCNVMFSFDRPQDLSLVVLAIVDILIRLAAMAAIAFIIYGGIRMTMAQGEPDKIRSARNTVVNSLVGLAIAVVATTLVGFIGNSFN